MIIFRTTPDVVLNEELSAYDIAVSLRIYTIRDEKIYHHEC
jgi:hypothetical protein